MIGRAVLAILLPTHRPRYSARKVKYATSRYLNSDDGRPNSPTTITDIDIDIAVRTPPIDLHARHHHDPSASRTPPPPTRRHCDTAIMNMQPGRS